MTMRVVVWTDSKRFAGTERHCLDLVAGLRNRGVLVQLGCRAGTPLAHFAQEEGLELLPLHGGSGALGSVTRLSALLSAGAVDVIHAHNGRTAFLGCVAARHAGRGAVVATQHFIEPARVRRRGMAAAVSARVHRWINTRVDRWISISRAVAEAMAARGDAGQDRMRIVPNGVRAPSAGEPHQHAARELLGLAGGIPVLVCPARLDTEKGHVVLINALVLLQREGLLPYTLLIGDGPERESLRAKIAALGLSGSVHLVGHQPDTGVWMRAADLFVLPSPAEPFGLVLLEAMSRSLPAVAANRGGPKEILADGGGLLFAPGDPRDLAFKLLRLLQDPAERGRLGQEGRRIWHSQYQAARMVDSILRVYQEVC